MNNECVNTNDYIETYKHLIGCEFVFHKQKGKWIIKVWCDVDDKHLCFQDNAGYTYSVKEGDLKLYLDEDTLGTYEEYMELHYPEYT